MRFFIHHQKNRTPVRSGHYGPVTAPTLVSTDHSVHSARHPNVCGGNDDDDPFGPQRLMPVRIDPEEEKRVALMRKQIAASEAQREVMETEYMCRCRPTALTSASV